MVTGCELAVASGVIRQHDAVESLRKFLHRAKHGRGGGKLTEIELRRLMLVEHRISAKLLGAPVDDDARALRYSGVSRLPEAEPAPDSWRSDDEEKRVGGLAIVYESEAPILGDVVEVIARGAADHIVDDGSVALVLNHNDDLILARNLKTMALRADARGVHVEARLPRSDLGWRVWVSTTRGDLTKMSFAFSGAEDTWEPKGTDGALRRITRIGRVWEFSPVVWPAYATTTWGARSAVPSARHSGGGDLAYWRGRVRDNEKKTRRDPELARWRQRIRERELALR